MMLSKFTQIVDSTSDLIPTAGAPEGSLLSFNPLELLGRSEWLTGAGIFGFLGMLWSVYAVLAYLVAIGFLALYVYASIQKTQYEDLQTRVLRDAEELYAEQYLGASRNSRLVDLLRHVDSDNPNDWRLAIIEADIILDDALKSRGYVGSSLGERLRNITPNQLPSLNDAWEAHKVRNRIAHDGTDFVLTKRIAQETIARYQRVFGEFGIR